MIGYDYADIYVAKCLRVFPSYATGIQHERNCVECNRDERDESDDHNQERTNDFH